MNSFKIAVSHLYDGTAILADKVLTIDNGVIMKVDDAGSHENIRQGLLIPGFIDIQVNGGGGYLFNQQPSVDSIKKIADAHAQFGTTGWLPTLVTDSFERMQAAADAVAQSIVIEPSVLGIHFEGPFLSVNKKGVHSEQHIRELSDKDIQLMSRQDLGKVLVTIAPENVSPTQISELVSEGIIVSIGHSAATYSQTLDALQAGATGFTHLYNAMSGLSSREPGVVGAALTTKNTYSGIILDGIHLHPAAAKVAFGSETELMLVTDAMPPVGTTDTDFEFFGQAIKRQGNQLTDSNGRLAGSTLDMLNAVKNAERMLAIDFHKAVDLATINPAKFLGLDQRMAKLAEGFEADMLFLDEQQNIVASWVKGKQILD